MNYELRRIQDADLNGKTVLLRADLDVPVVGEYVSDDFRLLASLKTIDYLLEKAKLVVIVGHLGRPEGIDKKLSLNIIGRWYSKNLKLQSSSSKLNDFSGWRIGEKLILLENLRFYKEEEENNEEFSKKLASLADIYVNDAFASCHRAHASIAGVTQYLPSYAGLRIQEEVKTLSEVLENPKRPLCVIIGGAKIETKLPLVEKMHGFADFVLVGGEIAENDKVLLKVAHEKIQAQKAVLLVADLASNLKDITEKSAENFLQIAQKSQAIVWNGPMGLVEQKEYENGTRVLAEGLSQLSSYRIVGGGDTIAYLKKENLLDKFDFVSTGGGAMLEFLAGVKLPGLEVLK